MRSPKIGKRSSERENMQCCSAAVLQSCGLAVYFKMFEKIF